MGETERGPAKAGKPWLLKGWSLDLPAGGQIMLCLERAPGATSGLLQPGERRLVVLSNTSVRPDRAHEVAALLDSLCAHEEAEGVPRGAAPASPGLLDYSLNMASLAAAERSPAPPVVAYHFALEEEEDGADHKLPPRQQQPPRQYQADPDCVVGDPLFRRATAAHSKSLRSWLVDDREWALPLAPLPLRVVVDPGAATPDAPLGRHTRRVLHADRVPLLTPPAGPDT